MNLLRSVLPALLLLASAAHADDACLDGASRLADERALAALRVATEAACPCASYTGGRRNGRAAYQKCARAVLAADTSLRSACAKTAGTTEKTATCGTRKIACGRFGARHDAAPSCRVTPPGSCHAKPPRGTDTLCTGESHCADVVDWTAGTCDDVRQDGSYAAGARVMPWTKDSVATPGVPRDLPTVVWYPALPGSGAVDGLEGAVLDAPLDPAGAPYPVVLFSHGSCGYPEQSKFLTVLLATRGFIVVAPPHPGNTVYQFPACGSGPAQTASFQERPQDMVFVLNQILAAGQDPGSPFYGAIDGTRIAMMGHSFGGLTTYLTQAIEPRVKVAIPLAPAALGTVTLTVPSLTMIGEIDSVVNNDQTHGAYDRSVAPKRLVAVRGSGHYTFSDACFPSPDCNPPTTRTQDEAHALVLRYVVPFLEAKLLGDARYDAFLTAPPLAGVTVESTP
jgi:predicted dienelactone hydrolase